MPDVSVTLMPPIRRLAFALSALLLMVGPFPTVSELGVVTAAPVSTQLTVSGASPAVAEAVPAGAPRRTIALEKNEGQTDRRVKFLARGDDHTFFLTRKGAVVSAAGRRGAPEVVRLRFAGADPSTAVTGLGRLPGVSNYYRGKNPESWLTGIRSFERVRYRDIYPGIDAVFYGNDQGELEYDFEVSPGADPRAIRLAFAGSKDIALDSDGDLVIRSGTGTLRQHRPVAYQVTDEGRRRIAARYHVTGRERVVFRVGSYDRSLPLVIDPVLTYATYLGGSASDAGYEVGVDDAGAMYVAGQTHSVDFPVKNAVRPTYKGAGNAEVFVTKLNPGGNEVVYSTYLGAVRQSFAFAVNGGGSAVVGGHAGGSGEAGLPLIADEAEPPLTDGAYDRKGSGFVAKLDPAGALIYSTRFPGSVSSLGIDPEGYAYLTSVAFESDAFQPTSGAYRSDRPGGTDIVFAKLNVEGTGLVYGTYLGGSDQDSASGLAVDAAGHAYLTGETNGSNPLPATPGAYKRDAESHHTPFVAKIDPSKSGGESLVYATYFAGRGNYSGIGVYAQQIAVDAAGNAYVVGRTDIATWGADSFSTTPGAFQESAPGGGSDAFVIKMNADGSDLLYATFLGGSNDRGNQEYAYGVAAAPEGSVYVTGSTNARDFPTTPGAFQPEALGRSDAFVTQLNADGSEALFSTYLGGGGDDTGGNAYGAGIVVDDEGGVYAAGRTASENFPWISALQDEHAGSGDAFLVKIAEAPGGPLVTGVTPGSGPISGGGEVSIKGAGFAGATKVTFGDAPALDFDVISDTQIVTTAPPHEAGRVVVTVTGPDGISPESYASLYHYGHGSWGPTGELTSGRYRHAAALLPNGEVLVVGGEDIDGTRLASAELYDPVAGTWRSAGEGPPDSPLETGLWNPTATLLTGSTSQCGVNCGKVLVVGSRVAALYSPPEADGPGEWNLTEPPIIQHGMHTATLLKGPGCGSDCGKVLVTGSTDRQAARLAELYDPVGGTWSKAGGALTEFTRHTSTELTAPACRETVAPAFCGDVLNIGGYRGDFPIADPGEAELYDHVSRTWTTHEGMNQFRLMHTATTLPDGRIMVAGGRPLFRGMKDGRRAMGPYTNTTPSAEIYDPAEGPNGTWKSTGVLASARMRHVAALLPSGKVLVTGGLNKGSALASAELWDPALGSGRGRWRLAGTMTSARTGKQEGDPNIASGPTATLISSHPERFEADSAVCGSNCGKVLLVGGLGSNWLPVGSAELYTPRPELHSIDITSGPTSGATVTLSGTGFTNYTREVRFGDAKVACPSPQCTIDSYNKLTVTAPAHGGGKVNVSVLNEGGYSKVSDRTTFTYIAPPGEVGDLKAEVLSGSEIKLGFTAPAALGSTTVPQQPAQRFVVKQSRTPITKENFNGAMSLCGGVCSFDPPIANVGDRISLTVTDLVPGITYYYALKVIGGSGATGPMSNVASATTAATTPGAVTDLKAEPSENGIELTFSAAGSNGSQPPPINDYVIKQSREPITDERTFDAARTLCPDACSFEPANVGDTLTLDVTDLSPGTTYHYALRPRDDHGNFGPRSNSASAKTKGTAPGGGQATAVERSVTLGLKRHLVATGRVETDGPTACVSKVRVLIHRNRKLIKTTTSTEDGSFRIRLPDRAGRYRATAPQATSGDSLCLRAAASRRHRH